MKLETQLESILFFRGEPTTLKRLSEYTGKSVDEIKAALETLSTQLAGRGVALVQNEDEVMLGTAPEAAQLIEKITKEELTRDLGKAGLETLSIILYRGPISRRDIDYIRGVNSTFILRNLLIRGLVEKIPAPNDHRSFLYKPSMELITYLGLTKIDDLPEFMEMRTQIDTFEEQTKQEAAQEVAQEEAPAPQE